MQMMVFSLLIVLDKIIKTLKEQDLSWLVLRIVLCLDWQIPLAVAPLPARSAHISTITRQLGSPDMGATFPEQSRDAVYYGVCCTLIQKQKLASVSVVAAGICLTMTVSNKRLIQSPGAPAHLHRRAGAEL